ncbi:MAG: hypothetical protein V3T23_07435 [Nitrososphaerales archaeon]
MIRAEQKSSGSSGLIKLMIWTTVSMLVAGAVGPYLGIQQYLNLVGLGFLNILHIVALFGFSLFLLIIRGILASSKADRMSSTTHPTIDKRDRIERATPIEKQIRFESIVLETKSKTAGVQDAAIEKS